MCNFSDSLFNLLGVNIHMFCYKYVITGPLPLCWGCYIRINHIFTQKFGISSTSHPKGLGYWIELYKNALVDLYPEHNISRSLRNLVLDKRLRLQEHSLNLFGYKLFSII